jgi:murein DD-endopeptidase MepM/ murein hydrolase activator NlpD
MSNTEENIRKKLLKNIRHKYRFVVMNDESFEEKYSFKLSQLNIFTALGLLAIFLIVLTIFIISFSPLKEYIPGYSNDVGMRKNLMQLAEKVDSLEKNAKAKDLLFDNIRNVVNGNTKNSVPLSRSGSKADLSGIKLSPSEEEAKFRKEVEKSDQYDINTALSNTALSQISNYYFFTPIKGAVTTTFNPGLQHFGVDVVAPKNEAVKSTLDGTVIFAGWTSETGNVIQIQHDNNLVSIYKHNAVLLKKEGQEVKAGEAIAITGNSGELTTSPHLHFELWLNGEPIDPQELMVF